MKVQYLALGIMLLGVGGCLPDSLTESFEEGSGNENSSTDTTTVAPHYDDSILTEDSISGTKFDRTIKIVFADDGVQVTGDANNTVTASGNHVTVKLGS